MSIYTQTGANGNGTRKIADSEKDLLKNTKTIAREGYNKVKKIVPKKLMSKKII